VSPKRTSRSWDFDVGWWVHPDGLDYDLDQERTLKPYPVRSWEMTRRKGGLFEFCVFARYFRIFTGGPYDPTSGAHAVNWHRRMVRARLDPGYRRFLGAVTADVPDAIDN
jgi:hypothetical protein